MQNQHQILSASGVATVGEGDGFGGTGSGAWAGLSSLVEFPELDVKEVRKRRKGKGRSSSAREGALSLEEVPTDDSGPESEYPLENGLSWNDEEDWKSHQQPQQQMQHEVWRERQRQLDRDSRSNKNEGELWKQRELWREEHTQHDRSHGKRSSKEHRKEGKKHTEIVSDTETNAGRKRKRKEMETAVPWTEEMVQYLFETYDDVHRRLWIESRGKVKNQKKWDPIIKTMQERFSREFTKNQCESKYWKVRRECTKYKAKMEKRAENIENYAGKGSSVRELLKPKFFDVWFQVAGKSTAPMPEIELSSGSAEIRENFSQDQNINLSEKEEDGEDMQQQHLHHHKHTSAGCGIVREMQQAISMQLEASEKREEALNIRAELTMELLRQHMERMETTGTNVDEARKRQLQMIEGMDNKLDRLVQGLNALNGNIGGLITRLQAFNQN